MPRVVGRLSFSARREVKTARLQKSIARDGCGRQHCAGRSKKYLGSSGWNCQCRLTCQFPLDNSGLEDAVLGIVGVGTEGVAEHVPAVVSAYPARRIASKRSTFSPVTGVKGRDTRSSSRHPTISCPGY